MRKYKFLFVIVAAVLALSGCAKSEATKSEITVKEDSVAGKEDFVDGAAEGINGEASDNATSDMDSADNKALESESLDNSASNSEDSATEVLDVDYMSLYKEVIDSEIGEYAAAFKFALIYIDDNDIPELYYSGDCEASGSGVIYINPEGKANIVMMGRISGLYEPRKNLFYHPQGHMGYYYDELYSFVDGEFVIVHEGNFEDEYDENAVDEYGDKGAWVYKSGTFDGVAVNEEEYNAKLSEVTKGMNFIDLEEWVFTKNGETITSDEYWEHYGEEGYKGGNTLMTYEELLNY